VKVPEWVYKADERTGTKGFMEWGFLSTTTNKHAALEYSGYKTSRHPIVLRLTTSSADRPACIQDLSQYPDEREYLFAPGAYLEPLTDAPTIEAIKSNDGSAFLGAVEVVEMRLNANARHLTVDELEERKKNLHLDSFRYSLDDVEREVRGNAKPEHLPLAKKVVAKAREALKRHEDIPHDIYLQDDVYRGMVEEMLTVTAAALGALRFVVEDPASVRYIVHTLHTASLAQILRLYLSFLWRSLPAEGGPRLDAAARLCHGLGLMQAGIKDLDQDGLTPLMRAAVDGSGRRSLRCLIAAGADVDEADSIRRTSIYLAAEQGHVDVIQVLAELKADPNLGNREGWTPLHVAALNGHAEVVPSLVAVKADVNRANVHGTTPLHKAAQKGHVEVVRVLADLGADIAGADKAGATALSLAQAAGHELVIQVLESLGAT